MAKDKKEEELLGQKLVSATDICGILGLDQATKTWLSRNHPSPLKTGFEWVEILNKEGNLFSSIPEILLKS